MYRRKPKSQRVGNNLSNLMMASFRCQFCNRPPNGWSTLGGITRPTTIRKCTSILMKVIGGNCIWVKD